MWTKALRTLRILLSILVFVAVAVLAVVPIFVLVAQSCNMEPQLGRMWATKFCSSCIVKYAVTETAMILIKLALSLVSVQWCSGLDLSGIVKKIFSSCKKKKYKVYPSKYDASERAEKQKVGFEITSISTTTPGFKSRDELGIANHGDASAINRLISFSSNNPFTRM